jgi:hypothetical protein
MPIPALAPELNPPEVAGTAVFDGMESEDVVLGLVIDAMAFVVVDDDDDEVVEDAAEEELVVVGLGKIYPLICTAHTVDGDGLLKDVVVKAPAPSLSWM